MTLGGFVLAAAVIPIVRALARHYGAVASPRTDRWHAKPTAMMGGIGEALSRIVTMLRSRGIEVRLVIAPYHHSVNVDLHEILRDIRMHVPDAPVLNYADAIENYEYFADGVHMNMNGSEVFLQMLLRDGVLATH